MEYSSFFPVVTPEAAYTLGLLWADGNIIMHGRAYKINIETVSKDMEDFSKVLFKLGKWGSFSRSRLNRQRQTSLYFCNKAIWTTLRACSYSAKSSNSAREILAMIPLNLQHYWYRGLFDGDGSLYKNTECSQLAIVSSIEQDWSFLTRLCDKLEIKSSISRRSSEKSKSSALRITNKIGVNRFLSYIYSGEQFGLKRKYDYAVQNGLFVSGP